MHHVSIASGSLLEREMLCEYDQTTGECFHSFFEFFQTFTSVSILKSLETLTESDVIFISFIKHRDEKRKTLKLTLIIKM